MKRRFFFLIPVLAIVALLLIKPPSVEGKNPQPTASTQAATMVSPSASISPVVASAPAIGGRGDGDHHGGSNDGVKDGGGFDHEGNEHEGGVGHGDDDGRLPKPPSHH